MNIKQTSSGNSAAFLFIVWPFLALVTAFKNYRSAWAKNVMWAFVAFYGFTFAIGPESRGTDIIVYIEQYQALHNVSLSFSSAIDSFTSSGEVDVLRTLIAVVLSRFSDNPNVLTLVYGIIFGFFFSRNMWFVLERLEGKIQPIVVILFISFFLIVPIWDMNGFRFWTATHVFIYGALPFLFENNKKGLIIASFSILVHFAFVIPVAILFAYIFLGNRMTVYFVFFIATFFISEIDLEVFNQIVESYAPEIIQERTSSYRGEAYVESYREEEPESRKNWYVIWHGRALKWSVMGFIVLLYFKGRNFFNENEGWIRLFSLTLLMYGIANLLSSLPSGGRFVAVANLCALALITLYIQNRERELLMKRFIMFATPALLLYIVVSIRVGLISMSATAILGNPVIALFMTGEHLSMNEVLRWII